MCDCFLELCRLKKCFEVKKQIKIKPMETFTSETHCFFYVFLVELL